MATSEQLPIMEKCSERQLLDPESGFKFVEMIRMSSTLRNVNVSVGILSIELGDALLGALQENTGVDLELDCHEKLIPYSHGLHKRAQIQASESIGAAPSAKAR